MPSNFVFAPSFFYFFFARANSTLDHNFHGFCASIMHFLFCTLRLLTTSHEICIRVKKFSWNLCEKLLVSPSAALHHLRCPFWFLLIKSESFHFSNFFFSLSLLYFFAFKCQKVFTLTKVECQK